jgi:hypothetical protein
MLREISRSRARDFAIVGPTFRLLDKKVVPEMMRALKGIGRLVRGRQVIEIDARGAKLLGRSEPMRIWLGCAERPDSLESATYGALWFDEPGQAPEASHHVASSRVAVEKGRLLYTSRPYHFNWYKRLVWDRRGDPGIEVVSFRSIDNPGFPAERYEAAKAVMPGWIHAMRYDGQFTRPGGAVFDCFDPSRHCHALPPDPALERVAGLDFGTANMAAVVLVRLSEDRLHVVATYHKGGRTESQHTASILSLAGARLARAAGGSWGKTNGAIAFPTQAWMWTAPPTATWPAASRRSTKCWPKDASLWSPAWAA